MAAPRTAPVDQWGVESLRITLFSAARVVVVPGAFEAVTGQPPETTAAQPKLGVSQEQGPVPVGILVIQQGPDRIDVLLVPPPTESSQLPSVGAFDESTSAFSKILEPWLAKLPGAYKRIAFGVTLRLPVPSKDDGYAQLAAYLPFKPDPNSSDLLYQINRPRKASAVDTNVNRLSKWSVALAQLVSFGPLTPAAQVSVQDLRHMCRLEMDLNTSAESELKLTGAKLASVFSELTALAREIVQKGDIP